MANFDLIRRLATPTDSKIVLLVMDGLGGLPITPGGPTELEAAHTPHMDRLAAEGALGQLVPVVPGVTPGSGPAHLGLFGYDPVFYDIGRGVLEAFGVGVMVGPSDVAIRANFCTIDADGNITDRRAGRISSEAAEPIVAELAKITVPGVTFEVKHVKEYRFVIVIRGEGLGSHVHDTDPQKTGVPPLPATPVDPADAASAHTAEVINAWLAQAREILKNHHPANYLTARGVSTDPALPKFSDVYALNPACVAVYPMYKGVSTLVGMDIMHFDGSTPAHEFAALAANWANHDFFFTHIKYTDSRGEDGDFDAKVKVIEEVDRALPDLLALNPDVIAITGDHSTPARLKSHSWHPIPLLIWSKDRSLPDRQTAFGERNCQQGGLGTLPSSDLMPLLLAHAGKLQRFGA